VRSKGQFKADPFLDLVEKQPGNRVLGVTEVDLYSKGSNNRDLNFVFGQAQILGRAAVISLYRLRGEEDVFHLRALKEAVHELGHTMGLRHCDNKICVMRFSDSLADTDFKNAEFCESCKGKLKIKGFN
jgi:archaemetzincin